MLIYYSGFKTRKSQSNLDSGKLETKKKFSINKNAGKLQSCWLIDR